MNRFLIALTLILAASIPLACGNSNSGPSNNGGGGTPTNTPTPTPTPPRSLTINVTASSFPAAVTLQAPATVIWSNMSGILHAVYMDDGGTGCNTNQQLPDSSSVSFLYPSAGTFDYHCQYHSPCGTSSCNGCTGMKGTVVVQ